jgi:signal transduction histidine kinase/sugar phosphate isomerase/epimerase/rRNA maturation protein Nop10
LDLDLVLDTIAGCGFEGVEFAQAPDQIFVLDPSCPNGRRHINDIAELLERLERRSLHLVALAGGTLRQRMEFCGLDFRPDYLYVEEFGEEEMQAVTASRPFTLGLHPHWFMSVHRTAQVERTLAEFAERHPENTHLRFLPDSAHLTIVGDDPVEAVRPSRDRLAADPVEAVRLSRDRLAAVHLKDWDPSYGRYSHRYAQGFVPLGKGVVRLEAFLLALDEIGFDGWVVVEQDSGSAGPARTAWACADWLAEHRRRTPPDRHVLERLCERELRHRASSVGPADAERQSRMMDALLAAATLSPKEYYQAVVDALLVVEDVDAVTLYCYHPRNRELYLLAMAGLPHCQSDRTLMVERSLCGEVTRSQVPTRFDLRDPDVRRRFSNEAMLARLENGCVLAVPIFNTFNCHQLRYLLNVYACRQVDFDVGWVVACASGIARFADFVVDGICSAASAKTSSVIGQCQSKEELGRKLVNLIRERFDCEGVSVFVVNETGDRLECVATTGIEWQPGLRAIDQYYPRGVGLTGQVWEAGELRLVASATNAEGVALRSRETHLSASRDECIYGPVARLGQKPIGVIRAVNKKQVPGSRASTMFTDDDAAVLDAIVQAALPYLQLLTVQEQQTFAIRRMTHELQTPLVAVRGAVDFVQSRLRSKGIDPREFFGQDYLRDILSWTELMGRLTQSARLFASTGGILDIIPTRTRLMADVIAPAVNQIEPLLEARGFRRDMVHYGSFEDVPPLWVDKNQFQQVFFNLLSNAIKYAQDRRLSVQIGGEHVGAAYCVWVSDWGIGIEEGIEDMVFLPGFLSANAMRRDVSGQGIGLYVVRTIVEAHGGRVRVSARRNPTTLEIALPESLSLQPPSPAK